MRVGPRSFWIVLLLVLAGRWSGSFPVVAAGKLAVETTKLSRNALTAKVLTLLRARCGKCHGPVRPKGKLELGSLGGIARGGEDGQVVLRGNPGKSLLWQRVQAEEMPPDDPLPAAERALIRRWISAGAPGLAEAPKQKPVHWSFRHLSQPVPATVGDTANVRTPIDRFVLAKLEKKGLSLNPTTDQFRLIRRVSFDLTGLPPTEDEIDRFLNDPHPAAYQRMVERYLASSAYGERWGGHWLDTAGYADSNGYFQADTDRPLAYRYRDYVIRAYNADKPFDQFIREQLAGDELAELAGYQPGGDVKPKIIDLLEATHFLRNAMDGTDNSDGNADERRTDKYKAIEGTIQILGSSLFGLTLQCGRCHEHKFEPIEHREYYQLQAILAPTFNIEHWITPKNRFVYAAPPGKTAAWKQEMARIDADETRLKTKYTQWLHTHRQPGQVLLRDTFDGSRTSGEDGPLPANWSNTVPGDKQPAGSPPIRLGSEQAPGALAKDGALRIIESGSSGDRAVSTRQTFDWTPDKKDDWIQATFDLVADHVGASKPAIRIAFFLALTDFNDRRGGQGGNILFDGNPAGGAAVSVDYPGTDSRSAGKIGVADYRPGHNFGVRVTNIGKGQFRLEHQYDGLPDGKPLTLKAVDLPDGAFGFEYCCGRSFIVDNVVIQRNDPSLSPTVRETRKQVLQARHKSFAAALKAVNARRRPRPGKIDWVTDLSPKMPAVYRLIRGNYKVNGEQVQPAPLAVL